MYRIAPFGPGPLVFERYVFGSEVMTCRCFEYGR
jgi:hypothetical protein